MTLAGWRSVSRGVCAWVLGTVGLYAYAQDDVLRDTQRFAKVGDVELRAEVIQPSMPSPKPRPAVVAYHAGGWVKGTPKWMNNVAVQHAKEGRVGVIVEYRLARNGVGLLDIIDDSCRAIKWVRDNAKRYNIDPNKIAAQGNSAGGHLAAIMGVKGCKKFGGTEGSMRNGGPDAVLLWSAPLDLVEMGWVGRVMNGDGAPVEVSPVQQIKGKIAPSFLVLGELDGSTSADSGKRYCRAAHKYGSICEANLYKGFGHLLASDPKADMSQFNPDPAATADAVRRQNEFLKRLWP